MYRRSPRLAVTAEKARKWVTAGNCILRRTTYCPQNLASAQIITNQNQLGPSPVGSWHPRFVADIHVDVTSTYKTICFTTASCAVQLHPKGIAGNPSIVIPFNAFQFRDINRPALLVVVRPKRNNVNSRRDR